jgi:trehalose-6-phosphate synthase
VGIASTGNRRALKQYKDAEDKVIGNFARVNDRYSRRLGYEPLLFKNEPIENPDNLVLLRDAEIGLFTSIADGMGLTPFEMVIAQSCLDEGNRGVVGVSNRMGAGYVLRNYGIEDGVLIVDPFDSVGFADKIELALKGNYHIGQKLIDGVERDQSLSKYRDDFLGALRESS